jgi:hypothetical protein
MVHNGGMSRFTLPMFAITAKLLEVSFAVVSSVLVLAALALIVINGIQFGMPFMAVCAIAIFFARFAAIAGHELGHVIGAQAAGMRIVGFFIRPVGLLRHGGFWKWKWMPVLASPAGGEETLLDKGPGMAIFLPSPDGNYLALCLTGIGPGQEDLILVINNQGELVSKLSF